MSRLASACLSVSRRIAAFAATETKQHLGDAAGVEVDLKGTSVRPFGLAGELPSIADCSSLRGRLGAWFQIDALYSAMLTDEPDFAVLHAGVRFFERELAVAEAFHFAAEQLHAALERIDDLEPVWPCDYRKRLSLPAPWAQRFLPLALAAFALVGGGLVGLGVPLPMIYFTQYTVSEPRPEVLITSDCSMSAVSRGRR